MEKLKVHKGHVNLLSDIGELEEFFGFLKQGEVLTFDWETTGLEYDALPLGLSLHQKGVSPCFVPTDYFFTKGIPMEEIARVCNRNFSKFKLIAHNAKYDSMINVMNGIKDENFKIFADTLVMIHCVDPAAEKQLE